MGLYNMATGGLWERGQVIEMCVLYLRPSSNEMLFPVYHPTGFKRCDWNFSCMAFEKKSCCFFHNKLLVVQVNKQVR